MCKFDVIENALRAHRYNPDVLAARAVLAAIAAHRLKGQPVWPMIVAPPGAGKTELIEGLNGQPNVKFIDSLTPQTFISGYFEEEGGRKKKPTDGPAGLLHRLGSDATIIYPDFSTVLGMKHETKAQILAQMRRIYDGTLSKEFGTPGEAAEREWHGRITFVVAVTPEIDRNYSVFQSLGERFVMIRWPRAGGVEAALAAMNQESGEARAELRGAVKELFDNLPSFEPTIPQECQIAIASLAEVVVRARTHIGREGYKKEMVYVPEAESSTRLAQQLAQLAKGSALLDGRDTVNETDMDVVRRAGLDCIPPARRRVLEGLATGYPGEPLPKSTLSYTREELHAHGLLADDFSLTDLARECFVKAGFTPSLLGPLEREAA